MLNIITTPSILTEDIYEQYNGTNKNISTDDQRMAAFAIAESQMGDELRTPITQTTFTGTYTWPSYDVIELEHTRLASVGSVTAVHDTGCNCAADSIEISGCAWIKHAEAGIIDVRECGNTIKASCAGCNCGHGGRPYQARVVYTAGLPAIAASDPRLRQALVIVADLALEQIVDPSGAESGPGDIGVQSYSSVGYSETRVTLKMTAFGSSARANYAANMVRHLKYKRAGGLGY